VDNRRHLYHARVNAQLTLEQIGLRTALSPTVLKNLDEGRFELLPSGVYARSYVRTFAAAVGLNPEATLAELEHLLPGAPDPLPLLNARDRTTADRLKELLAERLASVSGFALLCRNVLAAQVSSFGSHRRVASTQILEQLRTFNSRDLMSRLLAFADSLHDVSVRLRSASRSLTDHLRRSVTGIRGLSGITRCGAAAIDALLLLIVDTFLVLLISWSSGIRVELLLRESGWALGAFCAIPVALYFLLFGGIAGSTLGGYVCTLIAPFAREDADGTGRPGHPLTLPDILRRTVGH